MAFDDSGCSNFQCIFKINNHILKLKQKNEDKFSLSVDHYKFSYLKQEEQKGNLRKMIEQSMKNPLDDVDKLLKSQLDKEKKEKEEDFISPKDIKEIKNNLNSNNNNINNEIYEQNKNILKNIDIFDDNPKPQNPQNVNDFKRNSNMFGLDFFTGDKEGMNEINNNNINNNQNNINNNLNNIKNAENPHNKEVINQLMNKIVPENRAVNNNNQNDNNKILEMLFDEFNGETNDNHQNKGTDSGNKNENSNFNNNFNKNINNSNNNSNNIFNEINNNFVKNNFNPQNLDDIKKVNSTPFDFDDDEDIL